ncbi:MAG: hypothetical protein AAF532_09645 [Planctomycetota bacterium]
MTAEQGDRLIELTEELVVQAQWGTSATLCVLALAGLIAGVSLFEIIIKHASKKKLDEL